MKKNGEYVGVDEKYIPEEERYVEDSLIEKKQTKKIAKGYFIFIGFIFLFVIIVFISIFTIFVKRFDKNNNKINDQNGNNLVESYSKEIFNNKFEHYNGTKYYNIVSSMLDDIVTNNKKNSEHILTVTLGSKTTSNPSEIVDLKHSLKKIDYEVSFEYSNDGYIYLVNLTELD